MAAADEVLLSDATAQAESLRRGDLTASELVDAAIARAERLDPQLNAVILPAFDRAREAVARAARHGAFAGVPFLMKDLGGQEAGAPYHAGMRVLQQAGWVEQADSYLVQRFREAGLVSLGRTNTPELGLTPTTEPVAHGPTRNPWSLAHSAGGSSGGSAAAVAAGIVAMAHASDGGGSIRIPASMCGLVGLKPSRGRNSFGPALGERWNGFSCEFVVTRSVRDAAVLLDATAGRMPGDPYSAVPPRASFASAIERPPGRMRIGFMSVGPNGADVADGCRDAVRSTAQLLEDLGHVVEEAHPEALDDRRNAAVYVDVVAANTARALGVWSDAIGREIAQEDVEPMTWMSAERGRSMTAADLLRCLEFVHGLGRRLAQWWENGYDLLLTPTCGALPPRIGELVSTPEDPFSGLLRSAPYGMFTLPFNMSGQPAISLPMSWASDGDAELPVGCQLVAAYGEEELLLSVAAQLEQNRAWTDRHPPVW